jgi:CRP-like cAMP-binding protein
VFDGAGYLGSAVATEESAVLLVPAAPLLALVERHPAVARRVIQILSARLRRFALLAGDLSFAPVTSRLAAHLLRACAPAGSDVIDLSATRAELAAHLGTVREEVSRALSDLARQGVLEVRGRRVRVLDRTRLEGIAAAD